jgi:tRNA-guanine family transglycosylase
VFSLGLAGAPTTEAHSEGIELKAAGRTKQPSSVLRLDEQGVLFRSYRGGAPLLLTPESAVTTQKALGADIILPLDELLPYAVSLGQYPIVTQ